MFSLRKWVERVARDAAIAERAEYAKSMAEEPVNVESELDDGIILLYAREHRLLPPLEWKKKAVAWQVEFETEPATLYMSGYWAGTRPESQSAVAVAMRRAILESNVEITDAAQKVATAALRAAKKAVGGSEAHP